MSKTWNHPQLGTFINDTDQDAWVQTCDLPAFNIFTWEVETDEQAGQYDLLFRKFDGEEPSATEVALALRVVANQTKLAPLVAHALWEDFNGRGPKSGMWWHDDMSQIEENFGYDDRPCPKSPDDLLSAMRFTGVTIREPSEGAAAPLAELTFAAVFEEEHCVGILTDGDKIIGTGYMHDVEPFES